MLVDRGDLGDAAVNGVLVDFPAIASREVLANNDGCSLTNIEGDATLLEVALRVVGHQVEHLAS